MAKVILAYSGGLDTSCCVVWLKEKGFEGTVLKLFGDGSVNWVNNLARNRPLEREPSLNTSLNPAKKWGTNEKNNISLFRGIGYLLLRSLAKRKRL